MLFRSLLEMALMGDGVPADEVYEVLATDEGVDRAFAKLDTIKNDVIWWEAGAQPPQLLADGEVTMAYAFNGRIFNAAIGENKPFNIIWNGQIYEMEGWVIPKGAPNKDAAWTYIKWATQSERQADLTRYISYGPVRMSGSAGVGLYKDNKTEMATYLPTYPDYLDDALTSDVEFWANYDTELSERFNTWLAN